MQLHWLPVKYHCIFKIATLVYKFLHSGSPSYFEPFLSLSSCSYSARCSHPDCQYLTVPPFHSSSQSLHFKSVKHFGHSFALDAPNIWNELLNDVLCTSVASFGKKLRTYLFAKVYTPYLLKSPLCLLGMTWLYHWINIYCLVLCSDAPLQSVIDRD